MSGGKLKREDSVHLVGLESVGGSVAGEERRKTVGGLLEDFYENMIV